MGRTTRGGQRRPRGNGRPERRITVRGVRRDPVDLRKLSRAVIALAQAQAEADAQALADRKNSDGGDGQRRPEETR